MFGVLPLIEMISPLACVDLSKIFCTISVRGVLAVMLVISLILLLNASTPCMAMLSASVSSVSS